MPLLLPHTVSRLPPIPQTPPAQCKNYSVVASRLPCVLHPATGLGLSTKRCSNVTTCSSIHTHLKLALTGVCRLRRTRHTVRLVLLRVRLIRHILDGLPFGLDPTSPAADDLLVQDEGIRRAVAP